MFGHTRRRDLNNYVDGIIAPDRAVTVRAHLAGCGRCRKREGFIEQLRDATGGLYHPSPPENLKVDVLAARAEGHGSILSQTPSSFSVA